MKTFKMLLLAIAALCVTACENDEAAYIGVPESIELSADASIIDFVVNSNSNWTLTVSDPWFKITPKHGSGKTTLKLGVDRNVTGAERTSTLEFTSADGSIERVPVSQPAYVAEMDITAAQTVLVKKGEQLTSRSRLTSRTGSIRSPTAHGSRRLRNRRRNSSSTSILR